MSVPSGVPSRPASDASPAWRTPVRVVGLVAAVLVVLDAAGTVFGGLVHGMSFEAQGPPSGTVVREGHQMISSGGWALVLASIALVLFAAWRRRTPVAWGPIGAALLVAAVLVLVHGEHVRGEAPEIRLRHEMDSFTPPSGWAASGDATLVSDRGAPGIRRTWTVTRPYLSNADCWPLEEPVRAGLGDATERVSSAGPFGSLTGCRFSGTTSGQDAFEVAVSAAAPQAPPGVTVVDPEAVVDPSTTVDPGLRPVSDGPGAFVPQQVTLVVTITS